MKQLIDNIWQSISGYVILAGIIIVVAALAVRFLMPLAIRRLARARRRLNPIQWQALNDLLANKTIRELYCPSREFTRELSEGERRPPKLAWLSPWPRAVKASHKQNPRSRRQVFAARQQIRELEQRIKITQLNDKQAEAMDKETSFNLTLQCDGKARADISALAPVIKSALSAYRVREQENEYEVSSVTMTVETKKNNDPLMEEKVTVDFLKKNPAKSPLLLPIAMTEDKGVYSLPASSAQCLGCTGAGKSGLFQNSVYQLAPFIKEGTAVLYGIDPKTSELAAYERTTLFRRIALGDYGQAIDVLNEVFDEMERRKKLTEVDLEKGELGRSLSVSKKTPVIFLMIDEINSFILEMQNQSPREAREAKSRLYALLNQGRAFLVFCLVASQVGDKETLGNVRSATQTKIVLRIMEGTYMNDFYLGTGAAERGYNANLIPPANPANKYASAGIGYVRAETGEILRIRLAHVSDKDIAQLILENGFAKTDGDNIAGSSASTSNLTEMLQQQPQASDDPVEQGREMKTLLDQALALDEKRRVQGRPEEDAE